MKHFLIFFLASCAFANEFVCSVDTKLSQTKQIQRCKLDIIRSECEKQGINVSGKTTTINGMVKSDQIYTNAKCQYIKINVTEAEYSSKRTFIIVQYDLIQNSTKSYKAEQVDFATWQDNIGTKGSLEAYELPDSTQVFEISGSISFDTKEIKEKFSNLRDAIANYNQNGD